MFKLIDNAVPVTVPAFEVHSAATGKAGETLTFSANGSGTEAPVMIYHWDFGDGTTLDGMNVHHAYTQSGEYNVHVTATGLGATTNSKTLTVSVSGNIATRFVPADKKRPE